MGCCDCGIPANSQKNLTYWKIFVAIFFGITFIASGIGWYVSPKWKDNVLSWGIEKFVIVKNEKSFGFSMWEQLPSTVDIELKVYMFNITNKDSILQGAKPELQEVGPFIYDVLTKKVNISFYDNGTAKYANHVDLIYNENKTKLHTNLTLASNITFLNLPLVVVNNLVKASLIYRNLVWPVLKLLGETDIIITKTAKEFMWGYKDPALTKLKPILAPFNIQIDNEFGLLKGQNDSIAPGIIEIDTGAADYTKACTVLSINNQTKLSYWANDFANSIYGTDSQQMAPLIHKSSNLSYFDRDLFRSITLTFLRQRRIHGMEVYRYSPLNETLQLSTVPENIGFCNNVPCPLDGMMNLSTAYPMNAPIFASNPHFWNADPYYASLLGNKLQPNYTKHQTFNDVEPTTGFLMATFRRVQMNVQLLQSTLVPNMSKLPKETFIPTLWYAVEVEVGKSDAMKIASVVGLTKFLYKYGMASLIVIGVVLIVTLIVNSALRAKSRSQQYYQPVGSSDVDPLIESTINDTGNATGLRRQSRVNGQVINNDVSDRADDDENVLNT